MPQIEKQMTYSEFGFSISENPRVHVLPIFKICRFFTEKFAGGVNWNSAGMKIKANLFYDYF